MIPANVALKRLKEGNQRYVDNTLRVDAQTGPHHRAQLTEGQHPFAIILGCADSRVPAEIVFDQGLGDLFVIRVAGNIAEPSQIGSVEYAAAHLGTRLVVVLGHSNCGAVRATLDELADPTDIESPNLKTIIDFIAPGIQGVVDASPDATTDDRMPQAVRANVESSVEGLRTNSDILKDMIDNDELQIIGAEYSLETGAVEFYEE
jgi:carbonic anhydrase